MRDRQVPHFWGFLAKFLGFNNFLGIFYEFPRNPCFFPFGALKELRKIQEEKIQKLGKGPDYWRDFVFYLRLHWTNTELAGSWLVRESSHPFLGPCWKAEMAGCLSSQEAVRWDFINVAQSRRPQSLDPHPPTRTHRPQIQITKYNPEHEQD